jgi:ABC-type tungstate transport system permease subunit
VKWRVNVKQSLEHTVEVEAETYEEACELGEEYVSEGAESDINDEETEAWHATEIKPKAEAATP